MLTRRRFSALAAASLVLGGTRARAHGPIDVVIIGAGAAGLTAAFHLLSAGHSVRILEASHRWGGRLMRLTGFSNVPLDLGAEWIHDEPEILGSIIGHGATDMGVRTIPYDPQTIQLWHKGRLQDFNRLRHFYEEVKFRDTTWYGFFEKFVAPGVAPHITLNTEVTSVALTASGVELRTRAGQKLSADKVIVTVPLSVLQSGALALPEFAHRKALNQMTFGEGFKVFFKFKTRFYPDVLTEGTRRQVLANHDAWDAKIYYDAALRKPTTDNLLGLFTVSQGKLPRAQLSDDALIETALAELTEIFGSSVHADFQGAKVQNWSQEPFINGSYSMETGGHKPSDLLAPIADRIYFAGEALGTGDAQSTVHGAAASARKAVQAVTAH